MNIEVCFSPRNFPLFYNPESIVVVIDILRATSAICAGLNAGIEKIIPVATIEEAIAYKATNVILAGERNGEVLPGFDFGNSPFSFMQPHLKNATVVLTTTNGTQAIEAARSSHCVAVGSFLNQKALVNWLLQQKRDVLFLCAGWKDKFNLEDTLFAGSCAQQLLNSNLYTTQCDSTLAAQILFNTADGNLFDFLQQSSHARRLERLNLEQDIRYCLTPDQANVVPVLKEKALVSATLS